MSDFPAAPPPSGAVGGVPAEFGQRLVAYLIDFGIAIAMVLPVFILAAILGAISDVLGLLVALVGYLVALAAVFWMILGGIGLTGQTPGKRMQGVKVVNSNGGLLGIGGAFIRYIVQAISNSILCGLPIGSLWMLWDGEKKTLYDKILDNHAIQVEKGELMPIFPNGNPI